MTVTRIYSEVREKVARWAKLNMYNQGKLTGMVAVDESMFGSVVDQHPEKRLDHYEDENKVLTVACRISRGRPLREL